MDRTIGIIFDFDNTLAPDSTSGFLESLGLDVEDFWARRVQGLLAQGWDPINAYLYEMIRESQLRPEHDRITRQRLRAWGEQVEFYPGVEDIFSSLTDIARGIDPEIDLEFYIISSGIADVLNASRIRHHFTDVWACDFHCNERGEIVHSKNIVSFTEKTRFLFQISKGLIGSEARTQPALVNRKMQSADYHIFFENMIFVGDGQTDVPCFALIKRYGGSTIGVCDPDHPSKWEQARFLVTDNRVESMCAADFRPKCGLYKNLSRAVQDIAQRLAASLHT